MAGYIYFSVDWDDFDEMSLLNLPVSDNITKMRLPWFHLKVARFEKARTHKIFLPKYFITVHRD
jgi:hypothetical protein